MPQGTISNEHHRYELKTLPEGYVVLQELTYHQMMQRRDIITKVGWEERRRRNGRNPDETIKAVWETMNVAEMEYLFKFCIVEHNITDENDHLLDFTNPRSYQNLNPRIGAEISKYIDELNKDLDEEDLENFPTVSKQSFGEETMLTSTSEAS